MAFSFGDLLADIGPWMMIGILAAGGITVFLSPGAVETYLGDGVVSMLVMIVIATPLYVCATASTPIAAALAMKGLSPGAALVFLLAGPATNAATITLVARLLGKKAAILYVITIILTSLGLGMAANSLYSQLGLDIGHWVARPEADAHGFFAYTSAAGLLLMILVPLIRKFCCRFGNGKQDVCRSLERLP